MIIARVGRALVCLTALIVLLGATTLGPSVTVTDGALTPPIVEVPAGGSVRWLNLGDQQHEIVAASDAFPPFSLAPGGTRNVAFMQPGRYPYLLDGAVKGTVLVVASSSGAGAQPPKILGADGQCPAESPFGGWIRYQTTYHYDLWGPAQSQAGVTTGCDIEYQQRLHFDMLQDGPHSTRASIEAMLPPALKGSARDAMVQQMLNEASKHALLDPYHVSRLDYEIWTDGCIKVPGGTDEISGLGPARISGTAILGEDSPTGFRNAPGATGHFEFKAMSPEVVNFWHLGAYEEAIARAFTRDVQDLRTDLPSNIATRRGHDTPFLPRPEIKPATKTRPGGLGTPFGTDLNGCPSVQCFEVEPTKCAEPDEAQRRDCVANPAKYAVLPFAGESSWRGENPIGRFGGRLGTGWFQSSAISWKFCCGCNKGQLPPDFR